MINRSPISSAYPTPFIFTLGTCHVLASRIFLYRHIALRTLLRFDSYSPFFELFSLVLLTGQILMPRDDTLKAEYLLAIVARDFYRIFGRRFDHHILALGVGTELFHVTAHHFLIRFKLSKLFVCGLVTHFFDEIVGDRGCAPLLRTFNEETLASRLCDLKGEEVFVTFFAEGVTAAGVLDKVSLVMFFVADFAKFLVNNLLRLND